MRHFLTRALIAAALSSPGALMAQTPAPPQQNFLAVGAVAPDFELPGATRYGVLQQPLKLSDYRGETVVLAFFYRVRGGG
jgi:peroxiredoxin Q/BCP